MLTLKNENVAAISQSREWNSRLRVYFRGSSHDPWLTLKDENVDRQATRVARYPTNGG